MNRARRKMKQMESKQTNQEKNEKKKKTPALGRVGYGCTGASSPSTFLCITRGFTQIAKMWLSCSDLETQHLLAERKRAMVPTEVSEPGRWAWHLRKQAGLDLWSPSLTTPTPMCPSRTQVPICSTRPVISRKYSSPWSLLLYPLAKI